VKVVVTNDDWAENDPAYAQNADGWPPTGICAVTSNKGHGY
jgi:hypothetical protein